MEKIEIDLNKPEKKAITLIVDYLRRGKVVILPTDTIYGLSSRAANVRAVNRIYRIKKREKNKSLIKLISSINMARSYAQLNRAQMVYLRKIWPGPVTVIVKQRENAVLPDGGINTVALRLPNNEFLTTIIKALNEPIISTSLNLSGKENILSLNRLDDYFPDLKPDLAVNAGLLPKNKPSKIIDIRDLNKIRIIRN